MRMSRAIALVTSISAVLAISACSKSSEKDNSAYAGAFLYGTDGNMQNGFGAFFKDEPATLAGMKGTAPGVELGEDFINRLHAVSPGLKDTIFSGEIYDAMVVSAIASQIAGTTDPKQIAKQVNGVTTGGTACRTVADCLTIARNGGDPAYKGVTLRFGFTDVGEPATASYSTLHFGPQLALDPGKTEYLSTGNERNVTGTPPPKPTAVKGAKTGAPLVFGGLLPLTGALSFASPPMLAGAALAVKEINEAGGVLGAPVVWKNGDDGTNPNVALATIAKHKADGVHILIGPGASGVAMAVLPKAVEAGMMMFSPSNTAAKLSRVEDDGLYFRTAPSDILQARAVADVMMRDGVRRVTIIARGDDYGQGLLNDVGKELAAAGVSSSLIQSLTYQVADGGKVKDANELADFAKQVSDFKPDGVLIVGFEESADAIKALEKAGLQIRH